MSESASFQKLQACWLRMPFSEALPVIRLLNTAGASLMAAGLAVLIYALINANWER